MRWLSLGSRLLLVLSLAGRAEAQQAPPLYRVTNLNLGFEEQSSNPGKYAELGGVTYFLATVQHDKARLELWRTDGTELGTRSVTPIPYYFPGVYEAPAVVANSLVYGLQLQNSDADALWVTDGTAAGTRAIQLGGTFQGGLRPTSMSDTALFVLRAGGAVQLWRSDGTPAGTVMVAPLPSSGVNAAGAVTLNGVLYFGLNGAQSGSSELWRTDGTSAGTYAVGAVGPYQTPPVVAGSYFYFLNGSSLWRSDGTAPGTVVVATGVESVANPSLAVVGDRVFFVRVVSTGPVSYNVDLYRTNGATPGTTFVRHFSPLGLDYFFPAVFSLRSAGSKLFVAVSGGPGIVCDLWVSDGTPAGTVLVYDFATPSLVGLHGVTRFLAGGDGQIFFAADDLVTGEELWHSDGTTIGTQRVADLNVGPLGANIGANLLSQGRLLFAADDGVHGSEPWVLDPGPGTLPRLLRDLSVTPGSLNPQRQLGDRDPVIFSGCTAASLCQLYRTDGTTGGTSAFYETSPRPFSFGDGPGSDFLFMPAGFQLPQLSLYHSDGTAAGTSLVAAFESGAVTTNIVPIPTGWLLGVTRTVSGLPYSTTVMDYWTTDGTPAGTKTVDLGLAPYQSYPPPRPFFADRRGGEVLFAGKGAVDAAGVELWRTDGTSAGTERLDDLAPGAASSTPDFFTDDPDYHVLFRASGSMGQSRIYGTDGLPGGSVLLANFDSLGTPGQTVTVEAFIHAVDLPGEPILAMVGNENLMNGTELYTVDGSGAPVLVRDIYPGPTGSDFGFPYFSSERFVAVGSTVFFHATDGAHGYELWKTDGTPDGTLLVKDIASGPSDSVLANLENLMVAVGDRLVFTACDDHGCEPWVSDGTEAGTRRLMDIWPGPGDSHPRFIGRAGSLVLLSADDGSTGRELWALRAAAVDEPPIVAGDLDGDGDVDASDGAQFAAAFGSHSGDAAFNVAADLDGDGAVTLVDYQRWLATYAAPTPAPPTTSPVPTGGPAVPIFPLLYEGQS
jgi:ELWxxDGT repeat protein